MGASHPLEYDPITNEHTAQMTLAKKAAMEHYQAGRRVADARGSCHVFVLNYYWS